MLKIKEKSQVTRTVGRIKEILEEVSANPDDSDLLKASVIIYELVVGSLKEDLEFPDGMKAY